MAAALNVFKSATANLTTVSTSIYTAPTGYTTVLLAAQISNITGSTIQVSANHVRSGNVTNIISQASIPSNDNIGVVSGKLILQTGDSLYANASANAAAQMIVSVLETANP